MWRRIKFIPRRSLDCFFEIPAPETLRFRNRQAGKKSLVSQSDLRRIFSGNFMRIGWQRFDRRNRHANRVLWIGLFLGISMSWGVTAFAQKEAATPEVKSRFELTQLEDKVNVLLDGKLFTRYHIKSGTKPILWPVMGPGQLEVTRGFPMREKIEGEIADHPHHRSLWFSHGDVNGVNFWNEPKEEGSQKGFGVIEHREFLAVENGAEPQIKTRNEWMDANGEKILSEYRTVGFGADKSRRWIDFDVQLVADVDDKPVKFGDTKEGSFGIRVAGWMKVDDHSGHIVNNLKDADRDAWGKAASWVDYHGELNGK